MEKNNERPYSGAYGATLNLFTSVALAAGGGWPRRAKWSWQSLLGGYEERMHVACKSTKKSVPVVMVCAWFPTAT